MINPRVETAMAYRRVFGSADGKEVLRDLLHDLYVFSQISNPEEVALHNFGMRLLDKIGGFPTDNPLAEDELETTLVDAYLEKPTLSVGEE